MLFSYGQCLARATFAMTETLRNGEPFNLLDENILKKADRNRNKNWKKKSVAELFHLS